MKKNRIKGEEAMKAANKRVQTRKKVSLPKTAEAAARAGHKRVRVNFAKLSDSDKKEWVHRIASTGKRINLAGTYREGPSADGKGIIRCYYDAETDDFDICHRIL